MRRALTLIEMVFVIVIIGIVSATGAISYHPRVVKNDAEFTVLAIEKKRREGISFDHRDFGGGEITDTEHKGCITLTKEGVAASYKSGGSEYEFKSHISGKDSGKTVCFDHLGRPSEGNYTNPVSFPIDINISYRKKSLTVKILPLSGYAIITN